MLSMVFRANTCDCEEEEGAITLQSQERLGNNYSDRSAITFFGIA